MGGAFTEEIYLLWLLLLYYLCCNSFMDLERTPEMQGISYCRILSECIYE